MADNEEDRTADGAQEGDGAEGREGAHAPGMGDENNRPDDTLAKEKKCPECGEPVDDVRATCINCGYEYKEEDHEDTDAGAEFVTGSQIDDEGNELPDEEPDAEPQEPSGEEEA